MASKNPSRGEIAAKLRDQNLDEWLGWWRASQGDDKPQAIELMADVVPFPTNRKLMVLDLCCGPGDVGRQLHRRFRNARVDCVDNDPFLLSLCAAVNQRDGVPGTTFSRDLWKPGWPRGLCRDYHVAAAAYSLHWFTPRRVREIFAEVFKLLRPGGVFMLLEPASVEPVFASRFAAWRARQPTTSDPKAWDRFWARANALLGHYEMDESDDPEIIGEEGIPLREWRRMLDDAGFQSTDVLMRRADIAVFAAIKPRVAR